MQPRLRRDAVRCGRSSRQVEDHRNVSVSQRCAATLHDYRRSFVLAIERIANIYFSEWKIRLRQILYNLYEKEFFFCQCSGIILQISNGAGGPRYRYL